tara:strand:+ start:213 stop:1325 length:1113 start_codon:yes stop_codon:yes gene_type:complete
MLRPWIIALAVLGLASLWMLSGYVGSAAEEPHPEATDEQQAKALPRVRVEEFTAGDNVRELMIQGRSKADRTVVISSQTDGQLTDVLVDRGDIVAKGDLIAEIDIESRENLVAEAKALVEQRRMEFTAADKLSERGFQSAVRLAETKAALETAQAALEQARNELGYTKITAPIEGVVLQRMTETGAFVKRGDQMFEIVDLDPIKIVGSIPEAEVGLIQLGQPARIAALTSKPIEGTVTFIAPQANETTRTFEFEVAVPNPDSAIRAGLTSAIYLPISGEPTHLLPASILTLDEAGKLGVKILDADNHVVFREVSLVDDTPSGIYVQGLPEHVRIITVGQEFVTVGQEVEPVTDASPATDSPASDPQVSEG